MLQIYCKNTGTSRNYQEGTSLLNMLPDFEFDRPYPIVSAKVNNVSQGLKFRAYQNKDIEFIDVRHPSGMRVYCRSLCAARFIWSTLSPTDISVISTKRTPPQ